MTAANLALANAIKLEAKKDALAQRQSGDWKVSFTVQGIDMDPRLTQAAMGTRFAMVLVEIGDDELPVNRKEAMPDTQSSVHRLETRPEPNPPARAKLDWREVQPAAQAGIRCDDPVFQTFLREEHGYHGATNPEDTASAVRHICVVKSRSEFSTDHRKRVLWHQLDSQFQAWKAVEHA